MDGVGLILEGDPSRAALMYNRFPNHIRDRIIWSKSVEECIDVLSTYTSELFLVSLEHDLDGKKFMNSAREDCGMEVIRWLEKQDSEKFKDCQFIVHSWNLKAARKMHRRLKKAGYNTLQIPFGM